MLTIRFARIGKKNRAQFQIVLQEHTVAPGGRHVAVLGSYDPHLKKAVLKEEKIKEWIGKGAQLSDTVHNLLLAKGIITGEKRKVKIPAKKVEPSVAEAVEGKEVKTEEVKPEGAKTEEVKVEDTKEAPKTE